MNNHLMLDFETLGTDPDTCVLSLGAVTFTINGIIEEKEWHFNLHGQMRAKRSVNPDTLVWWMNQGGEAKAVFEKSIKSPLMCGQFAPEFAAWIAPHNVKVWGNGATFDVSIVENIMKSFAVPYPWRFTNVRCYRTIKAGYDIEGGQFRAGVKHNALDDARFQAQCLIRYFKADPKRDK